MGSNILQRAFSAGELAPALGARADLARYTAGARTVRNFVVQEHGGAANRSGTQFVAEVKSSSLRTYLLPVIFSDDLAYVIEAGDQYFRFVRLADQVETAPGVAYELATPYVTADLATLEFEQNGDTLTITHQLYQPRELRRVADTNWTLTAITTTPSISAPTGLGHGGALAGTENRRYVVTAVKAETYEESLASNVELVSLCAEPTTANPIAITWSAVAGAVEYHVYLEPYGSAAQTSGAYGFIGRTSDVFFNDVGLLPDFTVTPPLIRTLFQSAGNYPRVVGYYQQRRLFGNTINNPETVWASRIGFFSNFSIRSPLQDDDAVTFRLASRGAQDVRSLIDLKRLLVMTGRGEWKIQGDGEGGALIPTGINPDRQGYTGTAYVRPVVIGQTVIFVQARGTRVRDLSFDQEVGGVGSRDLTVYSRHLFKNKTIARMALAITPDTVLWAVRSDGTLLGMTYVRDQDVIAWHRHDTGDGDSFEDVVVVPEGDEDAVYVLVKRTINGITKRYIERFVSRELTPATDFDEQIQVLASEAWFVDSGLEYAGAPATTIGGLTHLIGRTVNVLADGVALAGPFVVGSTGEIELPASASFVKVGLPIVADLETLDLDIQGTEVRAKKKKVANVTILVEASSRGFYVGPNAEKLSLTRRESWDASQTIDGAVEAVVSTTWSQTGRVFIRHTDPTPLTVLGIIPNVDAGG